MIQNAYVGLGSNLGDRAGYLLLAVRGMLDAGLDVIRLSSIYETEPVGYEEQPPFLNMVAELRGSARVASCLFPWRNSFRTSFIRCLENQSANCYHRI